MFSLTVAFVVTDNFLITFFSAYYHLFYQIVYFTYFNQIIVIMDKNENLEYFSSTKFSFLSFLKVIY